MQLVTIETKCHKNSPEGLIVGHKEDLDHLIAAFGHQVHEKHPNPERIGCPGGPALTRLATEPKAFGSGSIFDHVRQCAACLNDLRDLRGSRKREER
jgi:hypothetical protein